MSSQTTNLKLHKIDLTDSPPDITVLNANWDTLDTAVTGKQATVTGGASTITSSNLTADRVLISNSSGKVAVSAVTSTELGHLDGVTSAIQTQLDGKSASGHTHGAATTSAAGFMSAADKTKLDGITSGANAYTLPAAGTALGGVKSGGDVTISNGTITVNDDSHNHVISNVDGLQTALDGKSDAGHTHSNATTSVAGFVSTGTQTFGGDKTFNGSTTKFKDILPSDSGTYSAGNSSYPFLGMTSRSFYVRPSGNTGDSYGHLRATTLGTTSTVGVTELKVGNNIASGTAQNAKGQIALYGSGTGSTAITSANTSSTSYAVTVPAASGSFALYEASTTDLTAGTSSLSTGKMYLVYE